MRPEKKVQSLHWPTSTTAKPEWRVLLSTAKTSPTRSTSRSTTTLSDMTSRAVSSSNSWGGCEQVCRDLGHSQSVHERQQSPNVVSHLDKDSDEGDRHSGDTAEDGARSHQGEAADVGLVQTGQYVAHEAAHRRTERHRGHEIPRRDRDAEDKHRDQKVNAEHSCSSAH
eukprot:scaffold161988_cov34-Tisochrysis_lutea.AAC.4